MLCDPQARLVPLWSSEHPSGSQINAICLAVHCPARPHPLGTLPEEVRRAGWSLFRGNNSHASLVWECSTREVIGIRSPAMVRRRNGTGWGRTVTQLWPVQSLLFMPSSSVNLACFPNMGPTISPQKQQRQKEMLLKTSPLVGMVCGWSLWEFWLPNKDFIVVIPPFPSSLPPSLPHSSLPSSFSSLPTICLSLPLT